MKKTTRYGRGGTPSWVDEGGIEEQRSDRNQPNPALDFNTMRYGDNPAFERPSDTGDHAGKHHHPLPLNSDAFDVVLIDEGDGNKRTAQHPPHQPIAVTAPATAMGAASAPSAHSAHDLIITAMKNTPGSSFAMRIAEGYEGVLKLSVPDQEGEVEGLNRLADAINAQTDTRFVVGKIEASNLVEGTDSRIKRDGDRLSMYLRPAKATPDMPELETAGAYALNRLAVELTRAGVKNEKTKALRGPDYDKTVPEVFMR